MKKILEATNNIYGLVSIWLSFGWATSSSDEKKVFVSIGFITFFYKDRNFIRPFA